MSSIDEHGNNNNEHLLSATQVQGAASVGKMIVTLLTVVRGQ